MEEICNVVEGQVGFGRALDDPPVVRVVTLPDKDRGDEGTTFFHLAEDMELVVDHDVVFRGIALLYIVRFAFLVNVNQHMAFNGFENPGAVDLDRLKHDIAIGHNHDLPLPLQHSDDVQCPRV